MQRDRLRHDVVAVEQDRKALGQHLDLERVPSLGELRPQDLRAPHAVGRGAARAQRLDVRARVAQVEAPASAHGHSRASTLKYSLGTPSPALISWRHSSHDPERGVEQIA